MEVLIEEIDDMFVESKATLSREQVQERLTSWSAALLSSLPAFIQEQVRVLCLPPPVCSPGRLVVVSPFRENSHTYFVGIPAGVECGMWWVEVSQQELSRCDCPSISQSESLK